MTNPLGLGFLIKNYFHFFVKNIEKWLKFQIFKFTNADLSQHHVTATFSFRVTPREHHVTSIISHPRFRWQQNFIFPHSFHEWDYLPRQSPLERNQHTDNQATMTGATTEPNGDKANTIEHDYVMAEYEDRFQDIDNKLDALRNSFLSDDDNDKDDARHVGATIIVDDDDDDNSTMDGSLSLQVGKLQASLAEQSATEMERIVKSLQAQQGNGTNDGDDTTTTATATKQGGDTVKSKEATTSTASTTSKNRSGLTIPRWVVMLLIIPTLASAILAYKLFWTTAGDASITSFQVQEPVVHFQQTYTRQVCRYINGQRYCESDQESQSSSSNCGGSKSDTTSQQAQQQQVRYQRQQCRYVNGESYCESYEESRSASGNGGGQQQQQQQAIYY